jgi:DnaJ-class molecular chaperone
MVNHRCTRTVHGRRCAGQFKSELNHVWVVCESCDGVGKVGTLACRECSGFGWRLLGA